MGVELTEPLEIRKKMSSPAIKSKKSDDQNPKKSNKKEKNSQEKPSKNDQKAAKSNEDIDFSLLAQESLKRYKKAFKLKTKTSPKSELINAVSTHFDQDNSIDEQMVIYNFVYMMKHK